MAKVITKEIIHAIDRLKLVHGSNEEIGKLFGISKKHVGQILSGNVEFIRSETWSRIEPVLRPHINQPREGKIDLSLTPDQHEKFERIAAAHNQTIEEYITTLAREKIELADKYKNL